MATVEEAKKELQDRILRCQTIINGLSGNNAFELFVEDVKAYVTMLDNSWHFVNDMDKLKEAQITKMAAMTVINAIDNYKNDINKANENLIKLNESEDNG